MINNNRQIAFQKDVTTRQQGGAVVVTLPKQSHIKSGQLLEFIKYENGEITLRPKKKGFWEMMSDKYSDEDIERMDQRDKELFDYNNVKPVGKERWWENE